MVCLLIIIVKLFLFVTEILTPSLFLFEERGRLNTSTGVMTIMGLIRSDAGVYTAEINTIITPSVNLIVICKNVGQHSSANRVKRCK